MNFISLAYDHLEQVLMNHLAEYLEQEEQDLDFNLPMLNAVLRQDSSLTENRQHPVAFMRYQEAEINQVDRTLNTDRFTIPITLWVVHVDKDSERLQRALEAYAWSIYRLTKDHYSDDIYDRLEMTGYAFSALFADSTNKQLVNIFLEMTISVARNIE